MTHHDRVDGAHESNDEDDGHDGKVGDGVKGKARGIQDNAQVQDDAEIDFEVIEDNVRRQQCISFLRFELEELNV